ncbi:FAD-binding oxidoreductase [Maribellus maritimus]|uniref:FAD-binding oxidoreductase n=1 Tax=Maribellus maritimus TaxID=2870838 RepID=UPI001EEC94C6|nr:FAD-binding oxidoreductase [Maribellus maritimus]MCG6188836.1 oxidoreductase [Maribellus maritimus]
MREFKVEIIRYLTDSTYVVRIKRNGFKFQTGQFVMLSPEKLAQQREYSVYSGENDPYIEVLIREVKDGDTSKRLKLLHPGDKLKLDGPFGFFNFHPDKFTGDLFLFVATGTGISPFHSFIRTFPKLNYHLIHGVRYGHEAYEHDDFAKDRITLCTSGDSSGDFEGRVTDYVTLQKLNPDTNCFLCGNSEMITEMFDILTAKGVPVSNIYSEVYF